MTTVAGLTVPTLLAPRLIAAIRARYPAVCDPIADDTDAVRAALKYWVIESLIDHEGEQAQATPLASASTALADAIAARATARSTAATDASAIT